jgi:hypothetical protein
MSTRPAGRRSRPVPRAVQGAALILALGLLGPLGSTADALEYGRNPDPLFEIDATTAGASPAHRLSFSVVAGELETYRARMSYPQAFRFRGFDALGPSGTPVGAYEMDLNGDGVADTSVTLRGLTRTTAHADVIPDGAFSPGLEPVLEQTGAGDFVLTLPFGGDLDPRTTTVPLSARVTLVLLPGLLVNPDRAGPYTLRAQLVSVDPDTGGPDDGRNATPGLLELDLTVTIDGPSRVRFRGLCIDRAAVNDHETGDDGRGKPKDRFTVEGRFATGRASNGLDIAAESVTVHFGAFAQTVPGHAFSRSRHEYRFTGRPPGLTKLEVGVDGTFRLTARGLDLDDPGIERPVSFALHLGDDYGEAQIPLDRHGRFRPPKRSRCVP